MPELVVGKQLVAYREVGEAGPPLLLVHGAGGSSLHFASLLGILGRSRRTIALDLPGHGRSPALDPAVGVPELLERYRDLCAELAERLGLGRFVLVGHSMGGAIGLLLAASYPERLHRLVVIAAAGRLRVSPLLLAAIRARFFGVPALIAAFGYSPASDRKQVQRWAATQLQAPPEIVLDDFRACDRFDLRDRLGSLKVPVSVIGAADDRLTPFFLQEKLSAAIAGARLHRITRAGHFVALERPEAVAEAILAEP